MFLKALEFEWGLQRETAMSNWNPYDNPVDYVLLASQKTPGIATVEGFGSPRKWDERKGYGTSGTTIVYTGDDLSKGSVKIKLYTPQHWSDWYTFKPIVDKPPKGAKPKAIDIWHPHLQDLGVTSVVVEDLIQPIQTADGEWTIEIKLIQYRAPKPAIAVPSGSTTKPPAAETPSPADKMIADLTNQVNQLAK